MTDRGYKDAVVGASGCEESMQAMISVSARFLEHLPSTQEPLARRRRSLMVTVDLSFEDSSCRESEDM